MSAPLPLAEAFRAAGAAAGRARPAPPDWYPESLEVELALVLRQRFAQYAAELAELDEALRSLVPHFAATGSLAQFADVEGELLYLLLRESRPTTVIEISPASGWSTNHILAALTRNGHGALHSFELEEATAAGIATAEAIRANIHSGFDADRLHIHVGDARDRIADVAGPFDFLFLDSTHQAWFAEWYLAELLPRTRGFCVIHDIVDPTGMVKHQEYFDGEAYAVLEWLEREGIRALAAGALDEALSRPPKARRLALPSFAIAFLVEPGLEAPVSRPRSLLRDADMSLIAGNFRRGKALLAEVDRLVDPDTPHLALQLAERYRRYGLVTEARALVRKTAKLHADDPLWLFQAGRTASLLGEPLLGLRLVTRAARHARAPRWIRTAAPISVQGLRRLALRRARAAR